MTSTHRSGVSKEKGTPTQLRFLLSEREDLREEIRQLRATIQLYAEIVRRLERRQQAA
jgi:hypothetical protein